MSYTLHFDGNGNKTGSAPADKTLASDEEYVLPEPGMTCGCAKFLGWATNATSAALYQPGETVRALASESGATVTLYAAWEDVFVVNFDVNAANVLGGHCSYTNATGTGFYVNTYDGKTNVVDYGSHDAPCRVGWVLDNWNVSKDGTGTKICDGKDKEWVTATTFGAHRGDTVTLYAQWTETTVSQLTYTDGKGTVWTYDRTGDCVTITEVVPGEDAETLELPKSIKGSTVVQKASGFNLPEKFNGLWWHYVISSEKVKVSGYSGAVPENLVIPSRLGGKEVVGFQKQELFVNIDALVSVEFPSTMVSICRCQFNDCTNLETVIFHEGLTNIVDSFQRCPNLNEVTFPESLKAKLENGVNLSFGASGTSRAFDTYGLRYADTDHAYASELDTSLTAVTVPDGVLACRGGIFQSNKNMVSCRLPEGLKLSANMFYGSTLAEVSIPGGVTWNGSCDCGTATITNVLVRGAAPSWDLGKYFAGLATIAYYANYAADWATYKAKYPSYSYVEISNGCIEGTVGHCLECDLEEDLGVVIDADYSIGDKVTVKIEGLAKGLKFLSTPTVSGRIYTIAGVPTETVDFATQPMFARVTVTYKDKTKGKSETLTPLKLQINPVNAPAFPDAVLGSDYAVSVTSVWTEAGWNWTYKGLPAGLKCVEVWESQPIDTGYHLLNFEPKDAFVSVFGSQMMVKGAPTKAGVYTIMATHKEQLANGKTTVTETETATLTVWAEEDEQKYRYTDQAYVAMETKTLEKVKSVSGLPAGIKFDVKDGTLSGTPTKPGVYVVTLTNSDKSKETFLWKVTEGENNGFLGAIDWTVRDSAVTVMQGVIQTNWNITVAADAKVTVSGLPTGLKLAQDKNTGKWSLTGTPTKVGNFVVTFKTVQNGVTKTERIAMAVTENAYAGNWYAVPEDECNVSWTASISVAAGGAVKLTLTEGTTNANAKGVIQSQVSKTTVTAKNFDGDGKSVCFTLPRDKKIADSVDRPCIVDFEARTIRLNGEERCAVLCYQQPFDFNVPEVATMVAEEFVANSTNAFAYLTATYNPAKGLVGVQGKLHDGAAVKATTYALESGHVAPFIVTDKSKNSISFALCYCYDGIGDRKTFDCMHATVCVNGKLVRVGEDDCYPLWDGFDSAEVKLLKSTKFGDMTAATNLVLLVDAESSPRQEELLIPIPAKSLATKLTAQGLVSFKSLKDADGWSWTCELLPIGEMPEDRSGLDTPFRGIATGTKKGYDSCVYPVWTK